MLIVLEGIDGTGKSTQAARLVSWLQQRRGENGVLWTREPGDWTGGGLLRRILLEEELSHPHTELYLFLADRCEHVTTRIVPALKRGAWVVCERYCDSTLAYQCWGRGMPRSIVEHLLAWSSFPPADLTLWIDVEPERAMARLLHRGTLDRLEREREAFLERVRDGFLALHRETPLLRHRIDGNSDPDTVSGTLIQTVQRVYGNFL